MMLTQQQMLVALLWEDGDYQAIRDMIAKKEREARDFVVRTPPQREIGKLRLLTFRPRQTQ